MADQYSGSDVARLTLTGANAGTTFTDALSHTFTATNATTSTNFTSEYGTSAGLFVGASNSYISSANSTDWDQGSGDFCADVIFYPLTFTAANAVLFGVIDSTSSAYAFRLVLTSAGTLIATCNIGGVAKTISVASQVNLKFKYHVAVYRSSGTMYMSLNGRIIGSIAASGALDWSANYKLYVGGTWNGSDSFDGYMNCFRLTKGQKRYPTTGGHTVPVDGAFNTFDASGHLSTDTSGSNTRIITSDAVGIMNHEALVAEIDKSIQALGWSLYDRVYGGRIIHVYRCLNKDGVTYKYAMLTIHKGQNLMNLTTMESWDINTKTATNEVWTNYRSRGNFGYSLANCDIVIFASARYLGMMSYINTSASHWQIVVENEREAPEDTAAAGYPCWGLICSSTFLSNVQGNSNYFNIAMPRTRDGSTGTGAHTNWTQMHNNGAWGVNGYYNGSFAEWITNSAFVHGWDNTKRIASSTKHIHSGSNGNAIYGRLYGVKATGNIGNEMDRVQMAIDSDGFFSSSGTATDHWILPTHNEYVTTYLKGVGGTTPTTSTYSLGVLGNCLAFTGNSVYIGTNASGVYKTVLGSGITSAVTGITGLVTDICFDGRYIYATSTSGIGRYDTFNSDAYTSLTIGTGGIWSLCWNGDHHLFCSDRTNSTTPVVRKVDTTTFTQVSSNAITALTTATVIRGFATNGDNLATAMVCNQTTAADTKMVTCNMTSGAVATYAGINVAVANVSAGMQYAAPGVWIQAAAGSNLQCRIDLVGDTGSSVAVLGTSAATPGYTTHTSNIIMRGYRFGRYCAFYVPVTDAIISILSTGNSGNEWNSTEYAQGVGSYTTATGCRTFLDTGNTAFALDNANNLIRVEKIRQGNYNGIGYPRVLIPR